MSKKDSYWFRHDSNAGRDIKLLKIKAIYKHWGIGVYWEVVEMLREQPKYSFSSKESDLQLLCTMIGCNDFTSFNNWFKDCIKFDLFIDKNDVFYSKSLISRMSIWETKKGNGTQGGRPRKPKRNLTNNLNDKLIETIIEDNKTKKDNRVPTYNAFYDKEVTLSNGDENYLKFVKVLFGDNPLGKPMGAVLKMRDQLSFHQFGYLWKIKEQTGCRITDVLLKMENWKDLSKRHTVLETFRTFANPKNK